MTSGNVQGRQRALQASEESGARGEGKRGVGKVEGRDEKCLGGT